MGAPVRAVIPDFKTKTKCYRPPVVGKWNLQSSAVLTYYRNMLIVCDTIQKFATIVAKLHSFKLPSVYIF